MKAKITNGSIITGGEIITDRALLLEDNKIIGICSADTVSEVEINAGGCFVAPGFVDIHTHGAGGADFMDASPEAFVTACVTHARHGTTALCPTTLSGDFDETLRVFESYRQAKRLNTLGSEMIGLHLEGPYFAPSQKGAQDEKYICPPKRDDYMRILQLGGSDIVRWSAAPELPGAYEFAAELKKRGILVSAAHTDADCDGIIEAFEAGFTHMTHLYSAMTTVHRKNAYRTAGAVEAAFLLKDMTVEIIADGKHLPPALLKLIYQIKGADNIALITDSMRAAGTDVKESVLGSLQNGQRVIVEDNVAKMPDRAAFAGSVATMDLLVRNMVKLAGIPLTEAVKMASGVPSKIIGCGSKGKIAEGYDADIVIFDDDINIKQTIIGGRTVFCAEKKVED